MKPNEHGQAAKILIVDDEPQIIRVLRTALSTQGYNVRIAANGIEGADIARDWQPDLVITDVSMPEMNGVELCRELRASSRVPIIVLSVRNNERMKIEALDAGADDYVTKPFSIQELQARVRAQLRRNLAETPRSAPSSISATSTSTCRSIVSLFAARISISHRSNSTSSSVSRNMQGKS